MTSHPFLTGDVLPQPSFYFTVIINHIVIELEKKHMQTVTILSKYVFKFMRHIFSLEKVHYNSAYRPLGKSNNGNVICCNKIVT